MTTRHASAVWKGTIKEGDGTLSVESGAFKDKPYSFASRFEEGTGTNPEELIGAAHAGCFSMALSGMLGREGYNPESIETRADVELRKIGDGFEISAIALNCTASIPDIDEDDFVELANKAKEGCPVSQALKGGLEISLDARLK